MVRGDEMTKDAPRFGVGELIAEGSDFARDAWRECWGPMLLVVVAHTVIFLNRHALATDWQPGVFRWLLPLLLIFYVPLFGGLYRTALGGEAYRRRGPGGLQWRGDEWLMIVVALVVALFVALAFIPFLALTGLAALIFGTRGVVTVGPLGQWADWAPAALVIWAIYLWLVAPRAARLALGWPYSIARGQLHALAGWGRARKRGWTIAIALLFALIPILLGELALYALALAAPDTYALDHWPLPEAAATGALLGVLKAAVAAPFAVGVLAEAYWRLEGVPEAVAATAPSPATTPSGEPVHPDLPNDAALAAGAALSAKEAAELDLPPSEVDRTVAETATEAEHGEVVAAEPVEEPLPPDVDAEPPAAATEAHEPAPEPHHPGVLEAAIAAALAAGAAAAAHAMQGAHHGEGTLATAGQPDAAVRAEPAAEPAPAPEGGIEALSSWPHSVLPSWPARAADASGRASPLASDREPAQPS
jgi:hypothetical protein